MNSGCNRYVTILTPAGTVVTGVTVVTDVETVMHEQALETRDDGYADT